MKIEKINLESFIVESGLTKTFISSEMNIAPAEISRAIKNSRKNSAEYKKKIIKFILNFDYKKTQSKLKKILQK